MAVVVAMDGSAGSWNAIRLAAQEARWRQTPLIAVTTDRADRGAGALACGPLSIPRPSAEDQAAVESVLRESVLRDSVLRDSVLRYTVADALGDQSAPVDVRVVAGLAGRQPAGDDLCAGPSGQGEVCS